MTSSLLPSWAERAGMTESSMGDDVVCGWGDMELAYEIRRLHGRYAAVRVDRGSASVLGTFGHEGDAEKQLLLLFAVVWRSSEGLPRLEPKGVAPSVELDEGPTSINLSWDGGEAEFGAGRPGRFAAIDFSYLVGHSLEEISASLARPSGRPVFP